MVVAATEQVEWRGSWAGLVAVTYLVPLLIALAFAIFGAIVDRDPFGDDDPSPWTRP